jgi:Yip1 domain
MRDGGIPALIFLAMAALLGWVVWAFTTYLIGTRLLPEPQTRSDMGELLRTTGFSSSPGVIRVLGVVPGLGFVSALVAAIWMLVTMVIAVRQALDYQHTGRAIGVCLIGWLILIIVMMLVGPSPFSGTAV